MNDLEVEILVLEAQGGSRVALKNLFEHFNQSLVRYAYVRVQNKMIAEDLTQNVWLKVFRRLHRLNDVSLFRSWLFRALRWEINDWFRMSNREVLFAEPDDEQSEDNQRAKTPDIVPLLKTLDETERETAELYYVNDLSVREVSIVLSVPEGTIKSRLYRARVALKAILEK